MERSTPDGTYYCPNDKKAKPKGAPLCCYIKDILKAHGSSSGEVGLPLIVAMLVNAQKVQRHFDLNAQNYYAKMYLCLGF